MDRDEQLGIIAPSPLVPQVRRRKRKRGFHVPYAVHRFSTLGYVSWTAFLVFWLVIGRVLLSYYMVTAGFDTTKGVGMSLDGVQLTVRDLANLRDGKTVERRNGAPAIVPADVAIYELRQGPDCEWSTGDDTRVEIDMMRLCARSQLSGNPSLVILVPSPDAPYREVVTLIDQLRRSATRQGCTPEIAFVRAGS